MKHPDQDVTVTSWAELLDALHSRSIVQHRPDEGNHFRSPFVFRGTDVATWGLETSLQRLPGVTAANIQLLEQSSIRTFRKYANSGALDEKSQWYVLAIAQHNGLPTRCLDWTNSPLVAAHFACGDEQHKAKDGMIWCLHVGKLREINMRNDPRTRTLKGKAWIYDTKALEETFQDLEMFDSKKSTRRKDNELMLLWEPPSIDARIANQSGVLAIMNGQVDSHLGFLQKYAPKYPGLVHRVKILASAKPEIRDMLDQSNISERTLFPGLPGLCSWLKRYYGKAW